MEETVPHHVETSPALASIERIVALEPITGADRIEVATVQGWSTAVRKGAFNVGDLCVWHLPDTILPPLERYAFLADRKYRLRCSKIRGVISEGLAMPLNEVLADCIEKKLPCRQVGQYMTQTVIYQFDNVQPVPGTTTYERGSIKTPTSDFTALFPAKMFRAGDFCGFMWNGLDGVTEPISAVFTEGMDMTELVGIQKYHKEEPSQRVSKSHKDPRKGHPSTFPSTVPRTDEPNVQSVTGLVNRFATLGDEELYVTLKMDGTSFTAISSRDLSCVCSRNYQLAIDAEAFEGPTKVTLDVYQTIAQRHSLPTALDLYCSTHDRELAIQGEICGPKIQGNTAGFEDLQFFVFSIFDIRRQCYVSYEEMKSIALVLNLHLVPRIVVPTPITTVKQWLELADSTNYLNGTPAEGLVVRTIYESPCGHDRTSFKALSRVYKLRHGE